MSTPALPAFHLAFPVLDLTETRHFYRDLLGCTEGRSASRWIDFDFHGHQISAHLVDKMPVEATNEVDGRRVPVRHFGLILDWKTWLKLRDNLLTQDVDFLLEPHIRFAGQAGEQATMFICDPSGNGLEFKAFRNPDSVFQG